MKDNNATNPFVFGDAIQQTAESRKLDYTPRLIALSNDRASELIKTVAKTPELHSLATKCMQPASTATDLIELISSVYDDAAIKTDAKILDGCDEDQLSRLLESRRSDRSKAKKKNPASNISVCRTYFSSMYAELLVREAWHKPYNANEPIDTSHMDMDAIGRKVRSLQSKKSRLSKLAEYDDAARAELEEVEAEIARLNQFRPNTKVSAKTVIKSANLDQLRQALQDIDTSTLSEEDQAKLQVLMSKLA